ncbi:ArsR/SmtB family transcription factor [Actinokineospora inagensis]|uniref:ArsR/SmtB family transcription factor n=1 Tax=Actinokineospora inagensis TaxID=103730 RepID=UPI001B7F9F3E|nr:winged helix-turn-helix domain-containing protein [Actinokineospora inagensis]
MDPDIASVAALIADNSRALILKTLCDGRPSTGSALAAEAGIGASTASAHLAKLVDARLVTVVRAGRTRRYRLARPEVAAALEALAALAAPLPVRSLRQSTRVAALRRSRTCYDHLAGDLGVRLMRALLDRGHLTGGDGLHHPDRAVLDRESAPGTDIHYELTPSGATALTALGVQIPTTRRPLVRYCVDWTERRHHLAGALGAAITTRLHTLDWIRHGSTPRVIHLTPAGRVHLPDCLGVTLD